jgi:antitoxin VapB
MITTKIFTNGGSQAVRLPKTFRFDCEDVCVTKLGYSVIITPVDKRNDFLSFEPVPDFMSCGRPDNTVPEDNTAKAFATENTAP